METAVPSASPEARAPDAAAWLADGGPFGSSTKPHRIDTHAASVFLTADRAWKIKRPVRFGYLDFSTPTKRKAALEEELRLNRRTAPDLYLGLHRISCSEGRLALDGPGEPIDYVLEMVRFADGALLAEQASSGSLDESIWQRLADKIAQFHACESPIPCSDGAARLQKIVQGNAASMAAFPDLIEREAADVLTTQQLAAIGAQTPLLDRRGREGHVRHVHGDLHLGNIALIDGEPTPFDCIEFSAELATTDVLYDLGFLLMDLWARNLRHEANLVFNRYFDRSEASDDAIALLPLFMSVRATVRAHVMAAQAKMTAGSDAARQAQRYLALAQQLLAPTPVRLLAIGGLSGTGKSTLARAIGAEFGRAPGARILRSDVLRKRLAGVAPEIRLDAAAYSSGTSATVYAELASLARKGLQAGQAVIADAVFGLASERAAIACVAHRELCPFAGVWLHLPVRERISRIEARRPDASDADASVARKQTQTLSDTAPTWLEIDARGNIEALHRMVMERLG